MSVAVDLQGAEVVRPFVDAAGVMFDVFVDEAGALTDRFGLNVVRAVLLFDEHANLQPPILRIDVDETPERGQQILAWLDGGPKPRTNDTAQQRRHDPRVSAWVRLAGLAWADRDRQAAARALDRALEFDPGNVPVRKQRWALREPDRFYAGDIDVDWQRAQRRAETGAAPS